MPCWRFWKTNKQHNGEFCMARKRKAKDKEIAVIVAQKNVPQEHPAPASDIWKQLQVAEYETLREELLQNQRYMYERPLVILAAVGLAAVQFKDAPHMIVLPLLLIWVLLVNLWFTANRLRSVAMIASYISVAIEPGSPFVWVGWTNACRLRRQWRRKHMDAADRARRIEKHFNPNAEQAGRSTYSVIVVLHGVPAIFGAVASFLIGFGEMSGHVLTLVCASATMSILFFAASVWRWRPRKMNNLIERQRAIWMAVFADDANSANSNVKEQS